MRTYWLFASFSLYFLSAPAFKATAAFLLSPNDTFVRSVIKVCLPMFGILLLVFIVNTDFLRFWNFIIRYWSIPHSRVLNFKNYMYPTGIITRLKGCEIYFCRRCVLPVSVLVFNCFFLYMVQEMLTVADASAMLHDAEAARAKVFQFNQTRLQQPEIAFALDIFSHQYPAKQV